MTTTPGMQGGGAYDDASEYQRRTAATDAPRIRAAVARVPMPSGPFTIVDYGCAEGRNSIHAVRVAVDAVREPAPRHPVTCIHNDLLTNDWNGLFANLETADDSYLRLEPAPLAMAAAGSFYDVVVPPASTHLSVSFSAAHWLREQPRLAVPEGMYFCEATGAAREALRAAAAADWERFLVCRAEELSPGARLIVGAVGTEIATDGSERVTARKLHALMARIADGLADAGRLRPDVVRSYVFPVYARTVGEAVAPVSGDRAPLADRFAVELAETHAVPNPYRKRLDTDGDTARYAHDYTSFVRAFAEPALRDGLFAPGTTGADPDVLVDAFFTEMERRLQADPDVGVFEDWTLSVVLARR